MSTVTTEPQWIEVGATALPEYAREKFLTEVDRMKWIPVGEEPLSLPFSPGESLKTIIREFEIRPVTAVSHSGMWEADDTTGQPGRFGDYTITYQVLGVRTRKQTMVFLDGGCTLVPIVLLDYDYAQEA